MSLPYYCEKGKTECEYNDGLRCTKKNYISIKYGVFCCPEYNILPWCLFKNEFPGNDRDIVYIKSHVKGPIMPWNVRNLEKFYNETPDFFIAWIYKSDLFKTFNAPDSYQKLKWYEFRKGFPKNNNLIFLIYKDYNRYHIDWYDNNDSRRLKESYEKSPGYYIAWIYMSEILKTFKEMK